MLLPATSFYVVAPKWYLTSPEFPQAYLSTFSWNSANIFTKGLLNTLAKALSLPLWAIPKPMYSTPLFAAYSTSLS